MSAQKDKLPPVKGKKKDEEEDVDPPQREAFVKRNWKKRDLKSMDPVSKSRYLAYEETPKDIATAQASVLKRLQDKKKEYIKRNPVTPEDIIIEKDKHAKLIGQLKAAEARNRLRIMRLRYQANRAQEINHLISCQPSALKAVRLQALVPAKPETTDRPDILDKLERNRIESLLEDNKGLLVNRTT